MRSQYILISSIIQVVALIGRQQFVFNSGRLALIGEIMFTTLPKTPQDLFNLTSDYFKLFPKNEKEVKAILEKVKTVLETETANSQDMWKTYQKALTGDASVNEIATANKKAQQLLISTRFAAPMGGFFIILSPTAIR